MTECDTARPAPAGITGEGKLFAALAWRAMLGPIFLIVKKDVPFVRRHARQGTVLFTLCAGISVILCILPAIISCIITSLIGMLGLLSEKC